MYSSASLVAENELEEHAPYEEASTPFHKWPRKDKRLFVERFCTITVPNNQNGSSKNLQLTCNCCGKVFRGQLITALVHLAGARKGGQRISICLSPNEELKSEVLHLFSLDHVHSEDALNEEALHIGEHFHHPNLVDVQLQQQQHFLQATSKMMSARDRATAKRKRDYAMKTLSVDPSNPIDVAILRFLADADLKPKVLELESFQEMTRLLRAAPKHYILPGVNRPEEVVYNDGVYGTINHGISSSMVSGVTNVLGSGVSSNSGVSSGSNMVHSMMQMNTHNGNNNNQSVSNTTHINTGNLNTNTNIGATHITHTSQSDNIDTNTIPATTSAHTEKRQRQGYTAASVDAGQESDSEGSVNTLPQM